jgi:hypothetical protein
VEEKGEVGGEGYLGHHMAHRGGKKGNFSEKSFSKRD